MSSKSKNFQNSGTSGSQQFSIKTEILFPLYNTEIQVKFMLSVYRVHLGYFKFRTVPFWAAVWIKNTASL